jgi:hypothetical protein
MQRTYCYLKDSFLFFLYDPLPRVLSASGVIMRFKKRLSMERVFRKTPRPLIYIGPYRECLSILFFFYKSSQTTSTLNHRT